MSSGGGYTPSYGQSSQSNYGGGGYPGYQPQQNGFQYQSYPSFYQPQNYQPQAALAPDSSQQQQSFDPSIPYGGYGSMNAVPAQFRQPSLGSQPNLGSQWGGDQWGGRLMFNGFNPDFLRTQGGNPYAPPAPTPAPTPMPTPSPTPPPNPATPPPAYGPGNWAPSTPGQMAYNTAIYMDPRAAASKPTDTTQMWNPASGQWEAPR